MKRILKNYRISNSYKFIIMENSLITAFLVGLRQISQIRDKKGGIVL